MPVPTAVPPSASSPRLSSRRSQAADAVLDLAGVTAEFLAEPDGRGILQMRAADLYDVVRTPAPWLPGPRAVRSSAGIRLMKDGVRRREMNSGGDDVVARLAAY